MEREIYPRRWFSYEVKECGIYRKNGVPRPVYEPVNVEEFLNVVSLSDPDSARGFTGNLLKVVSKQIENPDYSEMRGKLENTIEFANSVLEFLGE
jgi:hypothetical protein